MPSTCLDSLQERVSPCHWLNCVLNQGAETCRNFMQYVLRNQNGKSKWTAACV